jgi:hypothetical protein
VVTVGISANTIARQALGHHLGSLPERSFGALRQKLETAGMAGRTDIESAEITGLRLFEPSPLQRSDRDQVVFLASDTDKGMDAALVNAALVGGPIQQMDGPDGTPVQLGEGLGVIPVTVMSIPHLKPDAQFVEGAGNLARGLAWASRTPSAAGGLVLHAHGGFKAAIPFLTACAEFLLPPEGVEPDIDSWVRMVYVHEGTELVLELPLRRPSTASLSELDQALGGVVPRHSSLRGWAYTVSGRRPELTPIGLALKAMRTQRPLG